MAETTPVQTKRKFSDTTIIIIVIAGVTLFALVLFAAKIINFDQLAFIGLILISYPVLKTQYPRISEWLSKKQAQQQAGVIENYKQAITEILNERRDWGYPSTYHPDLASYLPSLEYVVFEVSRADVSRQLGYYAAKEVDWEGTIVFDVSTKKIYDIYKNKSYEWTLQHLTRYEQYFTKQTQKTYVLPIKTTETQIGLP